MVQLQEDEELSPSSSRDKREKRIQTTEDEEAVGLAILEGEIHPDLKVLLEEKVVF